MLGACKLHLNAGILRDKTIADTLMYIPSYVTQNYPSSRLKLVVEIFEYLLNLLNQPIKIHLSPQRC